MTLTGRIPRIASLVALLLSCYAPWAWGQEQTAGDRATHDLQIILLRASTGTEAVPELPEDAVRALGDAARILPYRHFERIDSAWLRTDRQAQARLGEAGAFSVELAIEGSSTDPERVLVEYFQLAYQPYVRDEETGAPVFVGDKRNLLASSFGVRIGETVVVGTSRVDGADEALIVLFKAVR